MSEARISRPPSLQGPKVEEQPNELPLNTYANSEAPYVDPKLVQHLERTFRARVDQHYDLRRYDRMVGHQEIIDHLKQVVRSQDSNQ